jgi:hypothetical protein
MRRYFSLLLAGFFGAIPLARAAASPMEFGLAMTFGYDGIETPHPILTGAHLGADEDGRDEVQFPNVEFAFNGGTVGVIAPRVLFLDLFRQASNPITPQKFNRFSGRGISTPEFWTTDPDRHGEFANVIAWAITVPEPSAFAVAATSLIAVSAIRLRR